MREIIDNEALSLLPSVTKGFHINYYHLKGSYLLKMHEYDQASKSVQEALKISEQYNLVNAVFNAKFFLACIDLFRKNLEFAIQSLEAIFKDAYRLKNNLYICKIGLFLSKSYRLKNLTANAVSIEKKIKPYFNKLDTLLLYEQIRESEQLYHDLQSVYRQDTASVPNVLSEVLDYRNNVISNKGRTIIGKSEVMQEIMQLVEKIAPTDLPVLIQGETGTGKELIARTIHINSLRQNKPFLALNCGAVAETLLENELFGHVKGAFTDAKEDRKGYIESASEGTLFIDEISEMSPNMQQKLLRVLEDKQVWKLGAEKTVPVNTRFIFASNQNIEELVKKTSAGTSVSSVPNRSVQEKRFREDLYYRINTIVITLPPLRDRKEDILLLVNYFVEKYSPKRTNSQQLTTNNSNVTPEALSLFMNYSWPGNVRELENEIKRICALHPRLSLTGSRMGTDGQAKASLITEEMISELIRKSGKEMMPSSANLKDLTDDFQRKTIKQAIIKYKGNLSSVARSLGYDRTNLNRKIKQLKIDTSYKIQETGNK
jgi:transcriptional regulator with PAS, ATPase and Fis domain